MRDTVQQLRAIVSRNSQRNNEHAKEIRKPRFNIASFFGGSDRYGDESEKIKQWKQDEYERREIHQTTVETDVHINAVENQRITVDSAVQQRAIAALRHAECSILVKTLDAIEVTTLYADRKAKGLRDSIGEPKFLDIALRKVELDLQRAIDNLSAMAVGPEIDLSRFDMSEEVGI